MIDVAGAAIETDHPVVALNLEEDPAHAERTRLRLDQREHAAAEPPVAHLGHQVDLVNACLPAAGLDAERPAEDHVADAGLGQSDQPAAAERLARGQRSQRRRLAILIEGMTILDVVRPHELLEQRQIGRADQRQAHGFLGIASCVGLRHGVGPSHT